MKDKNLPDDINDKSLNELTELVDNLLEKLDKEKDFENSIEDYQKIITLNNLIQKKFQNASKKISKDTAEKIKKIKKNEKKII